MRKKISKLGSVVKEISEKTLELGVGMLEVAETRFNQTREYLASDLFETHLDAFSKEIGVTFNATSNPKLASAERKQRVLAKAAIVAAQCAREINNSRKEGVQAIGLFKYHPEIYLAATTVFGSARAAQLFFIALSVVQDDSVEQKGQAA